MESNSVWQLFLGNSPYTKKSDFVKAWVGWWIISVFVIFIFSFITSAGLKGVGIALSFGFCQILARYAASLGWNKFLGVLGFFPVTNIIFFVVLLFVKRKN